MRGGLRAQSPGREAALAWASLAQRSPASSVLAREGAGCGSVGDVPGAWLVQVDSKGTQPYIYMYPFSPKLPLIQVEAVVLFMENYLVCGKMP